MRIRRNILVEGIDCSGKSTLVNELKNRLRWDARSLGHQEGNQFFRYLKEYSFLENTVIDRGHISEAIYSRLWNRPAPFDEDCLKILDSLVEQSMLLIHCLPDIKVAQKRYLERRNTFQEVTLEELKVSYRYFKEWFLKSDYKDCLIAYQSKDFDELNRVIKNVKQRLARKQKG